MEPKMPPVDNLLIDAGDPQVRKFSLAFYFQTATRLLSGPRDFFSNQVGATTFQQSTGFLVISALFSTAASLVGNAYTKPLMMGAILLVNAMGMVFISAGIGYMVMAMFAGKKVSFVRFFSIYAFASGITLLVSWIPFITYLTEPWKWWLVGVGMTRSCGSSWKQALVVIAVSMLILVLFFWSVIPVLSLMKF